MATKSADTLIYQFDDDRQTTDEEFLKTFEITRETFEFLVVLIRRNVQTEEVVRQHLRGALMLWSSRAPTYCITSKLLNISKGTLARGTLSVRQSLQKFLPMFREWPHADQNDLFEEDLLEDEDTSSFLVRDPLKPRRMLRIIERSFQLWKVLREAETFGQGNVAVDEDRFADCRKAAHEVRALYESIAGPPWHSSAPAFTAEFQYELVKNYIDKESLKGSKMFWREIVDELRKKGFDVTDKQCRKQMALLRHNFIINKCRHMRLPDDLKNKLVKFLDHVIYKTPLTFETVGMNVGDHNYLMTECTVPFSLEETNKPVGETELENDTIPTSSALLHPANVSSSDESECDGGRLGESALTLKVVKAIIKRIKRKGDSATFLRLRTTSGTHDNYSAVQRGTDQQLLATEI